MMPELRPKMSEGRDFGLRLDMLLTKSLRLHIRSVLSFSIQPLSNTNVRSIVHEMADRRVFLDFG
jgi:hypothetical protein